MHNQFPPRTDLETWSYEIISYADDLHPLFTVSLYLNPTNLVYRAFYFCQRGGSHGARALISSECTRIVRHSPFRARTSHGSFGSAQCILQVAKRRVFFVQSSGRTGGSRDTRDAFKGRRSTKRVSMLTAWWIQGARNKGKREREKVETFGRSREW